MPIPIPALEVLLKDICTRDRATARRAAILEILLQERYLTREQLIVRVEGKLGQGCFGLSAMNENFLSYEEFVHPVIAALEASGIDYLIGGAVATWAWGEPRATLDLDLVVNIPFEAVDLLSRELAKRGMLVPAEIILNNILETRSDLPIY